MGEYDRIQKKQESRAVANNCARREHFKGFVNNMANIKLSGNYNDPIQKVQPPIPYVRTDTLKGSVINRAFGRLGDEAKWSEDIQRWVFKCYHCKKWITEEAVEADHYPIAQAMGGSNELSNLVLACRPCNAANIHNARQMLTRAAIGDAGLARKYTE